MIGKNVAWPEKGISLDEKKRKYLSSFPVFMKGLQAISLQIFDTQSLIYNITWWDCFSSKPMKLKELQGSM